MRTLVRSIFKNIFDLDLDMLAWPGVINWDILICMNHMLELVWWSSTQSRLYEFIMGMSIKGITHGGKIKIICKQNIVRWNDRKIANKSSV